MCDRCGELLFRVRPTTRIFTVPCMRFYSLLMAAPRRSVLRLGVWHWPGNGPHREFTECRRLFMQIIVRDNNVEQALRALKKKLQREGVYRG